MIIMIMISSLLICFLTETKGVTSYLKPGIGVLNEMNDQVRSRVVYLFHMFEGNSSLQLIQNHNNDM